MPDEEDSDDMEIEKPPERRAPSGRAGRGNRMQRLIAEEEDEEEKEDAADKEFYEQGFWADEEADDDFNGDADDEEGRDSFDSDFGDSSESDDDDDDGEEKVKRAPAAKKKGVYKDPKLAHKKGEGPSSSGAAAKKPSHKKRPFPGGGEGTILPPAERSKKSFRSSTQNATAAAEETRKRLEAAAKARAERAAQDGAKRGVTLVRLTQAEILAEAQQTEIINRASLERMLRIEEEKRRENVRERKSDGPRVKHLSRRNGDSVISTVIFTETPVPAAIDGIAPPYPVPQRCAITGAPAKYYDPQTRSPYATLEAFRILRGRTGGRRAQQHSFSAAAIATAGTSAAGGADES